MLSLENTQHKPPKSAFCCYGPGAGGEFTGGLRHLDGIGHMKFLCLWEHERRRCLASMLEHATVIRNLESKRLQPDGLFDCAQCSLAMAPFLSFILLGSPGLELP